MDRINLWKALYRKEKVNKQLVKASKEKDTTDIDLTAVKRLTENVEAQRQVRQIMKDNDPTDDDINLLGTYNFVALTYNNYQGAGAACNITVTEAKEASFVEEPEEGQVFRLTTRKHKTASTYGPAILYLSEQDAKLVVHYINNIRDKIPTPSTCTVALVRANGRTYEGNYNRYVAKFAKQLEIYEIPSITSNSKS